MKRYKQLFDESFSRSCHVIMILGQTFPITNYALAWIEGVVFLSETLRSTTESPTATTGTTTRERYTQLTNWAVKPGGPFKPAFGLSGSVRPQRKTDSSSRPRNCFFFVIQPACPRFAPVLWALTWEQRDSQFVQNLIRPDSQTFTTVGSHIYYSVSHAGFSQRCE